MKRLIIILIGCVLLTPIVADVIDINLINGKTIKQDIIDWFISKSGLLKQWMGVGMYE